MSDTNKKIAKYWIARHGFFVWIGIILNLLFVISLFFYPIWTLDLLGISLDHLIWARYSAGLMMIISMFYMLPTIDFSRYRACAWLAIFPSRTFIAMFFTLSVLLFNQPPGFLVIAVVEAVIGAITSYCLIKISAREREQNLIGDGR
jgi:hypothetical protein